MTLYRKYRPQNLSEVMGQSAVTSALQSAIERERVAHAYLFAGPRGTGKTSVARIVAKAVNCLEKDVAKRPCNVCEHCVAINAGAYLDVMEMDAASNRRVDEARQLIEQVATAPTMGGYKVYILDEVHMLTSEAFNTLLKTLEEPPEKVVFILCTTELNKVPVTIASRCQRMGFSRAGVEVLQQQLRKIAEAESCQVEPAAVAIMAELADGAFRDGVMLLEQMMTSWQQSNEQGGALSAEFVVDRLGLAGDGLLLALTESWVKGQQDELVRQVELFVEGGGSVRYLLSGLIDRLRLVLLAKIGPDLAKQQLDEERLSLWLEATGSVAMGAIMRLIERLIGVQTTEGLAAHPALMVEMALLETMEDSGGVATEKVGRIQAMATQPKVKVVPLPPVEPQKPQSVASSPEIKTGADKDQVEKASPPVEAAAPEKQEAVQPIEGGMPAGAPAELLQGWSKVLTALNGRSRSLAAILRDCTPLSYDGTILMLQFWYEFHQKRLETDRNRKLVEEVATQIFGSPVKVRSQLGDPSMRPRKRQMSEEDIHNVTEVEEDASEMLEAASKIFGVNPE